MLVKVIYLFAIGQSSFLYLWHYHIHIFQETYYQSREPDLNYRIRFPYGRSLKTAHFCLQQRFILCTAGRIPNRIRTDLCYCKVNRCVMCLEWEEQSKCGAEELCNKHNLNVVLDIIKSLLSCCSYTNISLSSGPFAWIKI